MKDYEVKLTFAYSGKKLSDEDLEKENYNRTYNKSYYVRALNENMAVAKSMEQADAEGWCSGNWLYVIDVELNELK